MQIHTCTKRKKEKNNLGITLNAFSNTTMKTYGTENKRIHDEVFQDYRMKIKSELVDHKSKVASGTPLHVKQPLLLFGQQVIK